MAELISINVHPRLYKKTMWRLVAHHVLLRLFKVLFKPYRDLYQYYELEIAVLKMSAGRLLVCS